MVAQKKKQNEPKTKLSFFFFFFFSKFSASVATNDRTEEKAIKKKLYEVKALK